MASKKRSSFIKAMVIVLIIVMLFSAVGVVVMYLNIPEQVVAPAPDSPLNTAPIVTDTGTIETTTDSPLQETGSYQVNLGGNTPPSAAAQPWTADPEATGSVEE